MVVIIMKNIFEDTKGSSGTFVFVTLILTFIGVMIIWIPLIDAIIPMMHHAVDTNNALPAAQQDPLLPYMILIIDYFPLWVLIGLSIKGLAASQKRDEGDY